MILDEKKHTEGPNCDECWMDYPKPCECGGFIHASFGDENYDGDYWLYTKCDKCSKNEMR